MTPCACTQSICSETLQRGFTNSRSISDFWSWYPCLMPHESTPLPLGIILHYLLELGFTLSQCQSANDLFVVCRMSHSRFIVFNTNLAFLTFLYKIDIEGFSKFPRKVKLPKNHLWIRRQMPILLCLPDMC